VQFKVVILFLQHPVLDKKKFQTPILTPQKFTQL